MNEKLPSQVWEFSAENCPNGSLAKVAKFHTNPYNFVACLPKPYKLSILGDIWRATILPFSSSKYFCAWLRLSNLVDLSFERISFSIKRKTTILLPSPLTFLKWPMFWFCLSNEPPEPFVLSVPRSNRLRLSRARGACFNLVRPVLLYGCEACKLTATEEKKMDRFQFICLRRILRIWWPQRILKDTISQVTGVKRISNEIRRRRWNWIGHVLRKERDDDYMVAMVWQPEGKGREKWDDLKPHGEERWKKNPCKRDRPAGQKSGAQHKTGLVGARKLQPYAPRGVEKTN